MVNRCVGKQTWGQLGDAADQPEALQCPYPKQQSRGYDNVTCPSSVPHRSATVRPDTAVTHRGPVCPAMRRKHSQITTQGSTCRPTPVHSRDLLACPVLVLACRSSCLLCPAHAQKRINAFVRQSVVFHTQVHCWWLFTRSLTGDLMHHRASTPARPASSHPGNAQRRRVYQPGCRQVHRAATPAACCCWLQRQSKRCCDVLSMG